MLRTPLLRLLAGLVLTFAAVPALMAAGDAKRFKLVIDAGHGGHDAGAVGKSVKEKALNLSVALAFGRLVEANCPDVDVIYTRKTDKFIPLQTRAEIANNAKADLFISIHTNALPRGHTAYGTETYTLGMARAEANLDVAKRENSVILYEKDYKTRYSGFDPNSSESYIIFEFMQDQYMRQSVSLARSIERAYARTGGRKSRGVHQAGFLVLRETSMPSVLTEIGFISTPSEERFLKSKEGINKTARSIYEGFLAYKKSQDGHRALLQPFADEAGGKKARKADKPERADKERTDLLAETQPSEQAAPELKLDEQPARTKTQEQTGETQGQTADKAVEAADNLPVFCVQLLASSRKLSEDSREFKGLAPIGYYREGDLYKYTYGATTDYNEVLRRQREAREKFPGAFVVALRNGERIDLSAARREAQQK